MNLYDAIVQLLLENKPLLLFLVIAIGYFIGRIRVRGFSFGVAAVLFVGLAFGAMHPDMALPDIIYILGLVLFVYTIGLRSGPSFFASFKKSGLRDNLLVFGILVVSAALTILLGKLMGMKSTLTAGLFCGSLTNTLHWLPWWTSSRTPSPTQHRRQRGTCWPNQSWGTRSPTRLA
ncbi:MAG: hypothetical protein IPM82_05665 [Saprospiraceae bacterium]|nr:hypothetical protein [Saprospiraceae bacterium]